MNLQSRRLLNALTITCPAGMGTATVYTSRPMYRNLDVYRQLEQAGKLTIHFVRDVTTPNMRHEKSFITFTLTNGNRNV